MCLLLNSKKIPFSDENEKDLESIFLEARRGVSFWNVQKAPDNPRKSIMTICMNYRIAPDWGMQYLFSASFLYFRERREGTFGEWVQIK